MLSYTLAFINPEGGCGQCQRLHYCAEDHDVPRYRVEGCSVMFKVIVRAKFYYDACHYAFYFKIQVSLHIPSLMEAISIYDRCYMIALWHISHAFSLVLQQM